MATTELPIATPVAKATAASGANAIAKGRSPVPGGLKSMSANSTLAVFKQRAP
jgi:hypothetical protein